MYNRIVECWLGFQSRTRHIDPSEATEARSLAKPKRVRVSSRRLARCGGPPRPWFEVPSSHQYKSGVEF